MNDVADQSEPERTKAGGVPIAVRWIAELCRHETMSGYSKAPEFVSNIRGFPLLL